MNLQGFNFKGSRLSTHTEGEILYNLVKENNCKNIVEIGTYAGFNTLYLAYAARETGAEIITLDYYRDLLPSVYDNLKDNNIHDVTVKTSPNIIEYLDNHLDILKNADFILIDECLSIDKLYILWNIIKKNVAGKCTIVIHDVQCAVTDEMQSKALFESWQRTYDEKSVKLIETNDDGGFPNGFGVLNFVQTDVAVSIAEETKTETIEQIEPAEEKRTRKRRSKQEIEQDTAKEEIMTDTREQADKGLEAFVKDNSESIIEVMKELNNEDSSEVVEEAVAEEGQKTEKDDI